MESSVRNVFIKAVAACLPSTTFDLTEVNVSEDSVLLDRIKAVTGINAVRIAQSSVNASDLCVAAAEKLFDVPVVNPNEIDALIFVSQSRDYIVPSTASILQDRLRLRKDILAIDIPNGCAGYINGLYVAFALVSSGMAKNVLLLAGETNSKLMNPDDRSMTMIFGDAGSATIIQASKSDICSYFSVNTDGRGYDKIIIPHGGARLPFDSSSLIERKDESGNVRRPMDMYMNGSAVMNFALTEVPKDIDSIIKYSGKQKDEIDVFLLHQANKLIVTKIAKKCSIDSNKVLFGSAETGNTGPASIPLLLSMSASRVSGLKNVLMSGFGVGLNWGSCITDLSETVLCNVIEV